MSESEQEEVPALVAQAMQVAEELGFERSCSLQTGRLLRTLAAHVRSGVIGEIGTGSGAGAAWMVSALRDGVSFVTVEIEDELAGAAMRVLAGVPRARVIYGDWREILQFGPFALLFADAAAAKQHAPETLFAALHPGGMVVLDDLTPGGTGEPDPMRDFWLMDSRVAAVEVLVRPTEAVIMATRLL